MESIRKVKERGEKLRKGVADRLRKERRPGTSLACSLTLSIFLFSSLSFFVFNSDTSTERNVTTAFGLFMCVCFEYVLPT